jgi:hypothetical protein
MKPAYKPPMIGSFEDIGKDIARETVKVPTDIGGKILESLTGAASSKGQQQGSQKQQEGMSDQKPGGALGKMDETKDMGVKRAIARAALEQLASKGEKPPSSIWDEKQKEEQEKKEMVKKQAEQSAFAEMLKMSSKKRRGDLYGIKGKSSTEMSKNVRQD